MGIGLSDRVQLERAEARELVAAFWWNDKQRGREAAKKFLADRIQYLTKFYGTGFDKRVREYMRGITHEWGKE